MLGLGWQPCRWFDWHRAGRAVGSTDREASCAVGPREFAGAGLDGCRRWPRSDERALEVLRRRYAAGELTKEQFDEMKEVLQ